MRLLISIILLAAAIFGFAAFTNPTWKQARAVAAESAQFDEALDRSKELIAVRDALLSTYNTFPSADLAKLDTMLPDSVDTVRLIIDVNSVAARHNLSLSDISVDDADAAGAGDTRTLGPQDNPYGTLALSFTVSGSYDEFRAFLAGLERSLRLVDVASISFEGPAAATGQTTYTVGIRTYWMK